MILRGKCGDFDTNSDPVKYDPSPGCDVTQCISECVKHAKKSGKNVVLCNFNGVNINITPTTTAEEGYKMWDNGMKANAEKYRNSPEGKRAVREAQERLERSQREVDRLLAQLESFGVPSTDQVVAWLAEFSEHADHCSVKYSKSDLVTKLESFGYVENAHVAKTPKEKAAAKHWKRQTMGEYIIGQAINCLKHGMPPHPGLTQQFAEEYTQIA